MPVEPFLLPAWAGQCVHKEGLYKPLLNQKVFQKSSLFQSSFPVLTPRLLMNSHEIDYQIIGDDIQIVEIELDPNETVIAEAGATLYMEDSITFETKMGDGSQPNQGFMGKLLQAVPA